MAKLGVQGQRSNGQRVTAQVDHIGRFGAGTGTGTGTGIIHANHLSMRFLSTSRRQMTLESLGPVMSMRSFGSISLMLRSRPCWGNEQGSKSQARGQANVFVAEI